MKTKFFTTILLVLFASVTVNAFDGNPASRKSFNSVKKTDRVSKDRLAELTRNIEYPTAKSLIRRAYYSNLNELARAIMEDNYTVSLRGHADSIGAYKYNWVLSDYRAQAVKNYLVKMGVPDDRIVATPFGSTLPIASNKTPQGRQKNRRVEIQLKNVSAQR